LKRDVQIAKLVLTEAKRCGAHGDYTYSHGYTLTDDGISSACSRSIFQHPSKFMDPDVYAAASGSVESKYSPPESPDCDVDLRDWDFGPDTSW
jgi:hypothetical protein